MLPSVADDYAICSPRWYRFTATVNMNDQLSFSIVTPSLNQRAFIGEALLSVKNQAYGNLEHLVIDGGSQDDTTTLLRQ